MIKKLSESSGNILGYKVSGDVTKADYDVMLPEVEALVKEEGEICLLIDLTEFRWEKIRAWGADMKFGRDYRKKIKKMAIVGDKKWQEWLTKLAEPFYAIDARFFEGDEITNAWDWLGT